MKTEHDKIAELAALVSRRGTRAIDAALVCLERSDTKHTELYELESNQCSAFIEAIRVYLTADYLHHVQPRGSA